MRPSSEPIRIPGPSWSAHRPRPVNSHSRLLWTKDGPASILRPTKPIWLNHPRWRAGREPVRNSAAAMLILVLVALSACGMNPAPSQSTEPSQRSAPTSAPSAIATSETPTSPAASQVVAPQVSADASSSSSSSSSPSPTASQAVATLASGVPLPVCTPRAPAASDTVTFVASGYAWAMSPSGDHLTCLFAVADLGPFEWGPLGDRVLLGGMEVKGVAGGPSLVASGQTFSTFIWSRPTGKSIVYARHRSIESRTSCTSTGRRISMSPRSRRRPI